MVIEFRSHKFLRNLESTLCNEYTNQLLHLSLQYLVEITIATFCKIFSREKMLAYLAVFPEIHQIEITIRQIKFPWKSSFVTGKIKSCRKKNFHQL